MVPFLLSDLCLKFPSLSLIGADFKVSEVVTDSRKVTLGSLYVPIKGERFDGHDFIEKALEQGAQGFLCDKAHLALYEKFKEQGYAIVVCDDTLEALGLLGLYVRESIKNLKVVSITGSCGKTTVKELSAAILAHRGKTQYTQGNFNNDVGVPLTLLSLTSDCEYAVIEQGASHPLDIQRTCRYVKSQVALINNAGGAHLEGFGSEYGIYKGKSEILDDVFSRDGIGIVPSVSPFYQNWQNDYKAQSQRGKLKFFGDKDSDFVKVSKIKASGMQVSFTLEVEGQKASFTLPLAGEHNAYNAAAACALTMSIGANFEDVKKGLTSISALKGRLHLEHLGRVNLIDDSYNASFNSVISALEVLKLQDGFKIFCFGDMGELGESALKLHQEVGRKAVACADLVLCVGDKSLETVKECGSKAHHFASRQELIAFLEPYLTKDQVCVLTKGSHAMQMNEIAQYLREHCAC